MNTIKDGSNAMLQIRDIDCYTEQGLETGSRDVRINSQIFYRYRIIFALWAHRSIVIGNWSLICLSIITYPPFMLLFLREDTRNLRRRAISLCATSGETVLL